MSLKQEESDVSTPRMQSASKSLTAGPFPVDQISNKGRQTRWVQDQLRDRSPKNCWASPFSWPHDLNFLPKYWGSPTNVWIGSLNLNTKHFYWILEEMRGSKKGIWICLNCCFTSLPPLKSHPDDLVNVGTTIAVPCCWSCLLRPDREVWKNPCHRWKSVEETVDRTVGWWKKSG